MGITKIQGANAFVHAQKATRKHWSGIEHRLEFVGEWSGMDFINDSKATDIESVYYSLEILNRPIIWLCGNTDSTESFWSLEKMIRYKVISAHGFGSNQNWNPDFIQWVDRFTNHASLEEAFAQVISQPKDAVVLMSPGNASFELFRNFKERGNRFKELVTELSE